MNTKHVEIIGTVTWQTDFIEALHERTNRSEPTYFYEIDKLFDGMYSPKGRMSKPAFILSSSPLTERDQIQTIGEAGDEDTRLVEDILTSIGNHGGDVEEMRKRFIDAGVTLKKGATT